MFFCSRDLGANSSTTDKIRVSQQASQNATKWAARARSRATFPCGSARAGQAKSAARSMTSHVRQNSCVAARNLGKKVCTRAYGEQDTLRTKRPQCVCADAQEFSSSKGARGPVCCIVGALYLVRVAHFRCILVGSRPSHVCGPSRSMTSRAPNLP